MLLVGLLTTSSFGCLEPDEAMPSVDGSATLGEQPGRSDVFLVELDSLRPDPAAGARRLGAGLDPKFAGWRQQQYAALKAEVLERTGAAVIRDFPSLPIVMVRGDAGVRERLEDDPEVRQLHEDATVRRSSYNLDLIGAPAAQVAGADGAGGAVAIIDTGVDYTRAAFGSCTAPGVPQSCRVVRSVDIAPDDGLLDDFTSHGTNVAGVVAQIAPAAKLLAFDVFDGEYGRISDVLRAIDWLVRNGAAHDVVAANLSLGGDVGYTAPCTRSVFAPALTHLRQAGIVPVVSSGNDAFEDALADPACAPASLSVGAVYARAYSYAIFQICADYQPLADQVACFSNGASFLDLLAPGVQVTAAGSTMTGTSQAAPHVAGAVAAYATLAPTAGPDDVEAALKRHGVQVTDARTSHVIPRLDLAAAVAALPAVSPAPPTPPPPTPPPLEDPCPLTSSLEPTLVDASGAVGAVTIDTPAGCPWVVEVDAEWIRLERRTGEGPASVEVMVLGNHGPQRQAQISVGESSHALVQSAGNPLGEAWVLVDEDAPVTSTTDVTLQIHGRIDGQEPSSMCVSNEASCVDWIPYRTELAWTLTEGAGEKQVSVWLMRRDGSVSGAPLGAVLVTDTIELRSAP